jgi:curli production assembly/transport CsgH protein
MSNLLVTGAFWLAPLSIVWAATAMANGNGPEAVPEGHIAEVPVCEIRVDQSDDSIVVEGLVHAPAGVSGSYRMQVQQNGSGSSRIFQSGDFKTSDSAVGSLGVVSLAKNAGSYIATLTVNWDDGTPDCVARAPKTRSVKLRGKSSMSGASGAFSPPVQTDRSTSDSESLD